MIRVILSVSVYVLYVCGFVYIKLNQDERRDESPHLLHLPYSPTLAARAADAYL